MIMIQISKFDLDLCKRYNCFLGCPFCRSDIKGIETVVVDPYAPKTKKESVHTEHQKQILQKQKEQAEAKANLPPKQSSVKLDVASVSEVFTLVMSYYTKMEEYTIDSFSVALLLLLLFQLTKI